MAAIRDMQDYAQNVSFYDSSAEIGDATIFDVEEFVQSGRPLEEAFGVEDQCIKVVLRSEDARPAAFADLRVGDQIRVLGDRPAGGVGDAAGELLGAACLRNAFEELPQPWPNISLEAIAARQVHVHEHPRLQQAGRVGHERAYNHRARVGIDARVQQLAKVRHLQEEMAVADRVHGDRDEEHAHPRLSRTGDDRQAAAEDAPAAG